MKIVDFIPYIQNVYGKQIHSRDNIDTLLVTINFSILEIYKKFPLKRDFAILVPEVGRDIYTLDGTDAAVTIDLQNQQYLAPEAIFDANGNLEYQQGDPIGSGIFFSGLQTIKIVTPENDPINPFLEIRSNEYHIRFRSAPLFLTNEYQEIPLLPQFLEPLALHVAYQLHASVTKNPNEANNDNQYYGRFMKACNTVIEQGLIIPEDIETDKFEERGFV